jgi:phosphatidylglycerophosphate synthase
MKIEKEIKNKIEKLKIIELLEIEPNLITLLTIPLAFLGAYFIFYKNKLAILFVLLSFLGDALDGAIARKKGKTSTNGAYLDGMSDRVVEFLILAPFLNIEFAKIPALMILFFGTFMHSFSKAYADHRKLLNTKEAQEVSTIFGRAERVMVIFLLIVLYLYDYYIYAFYIVWACAILSILSFLQLQIKIFKLSKK